MRPAEFSTDNLTTLLLRQTIATMPELMAALATTDEPCFVNSGRWLTVAVIRIVAANYTLDA